MTKGLLSPQVAHVAASETGTTAEGVILRAGQAAIILKGVDEWMASFTAEQLAALHMTTRQAEEHAALVAIFEKERPIFHSLAKAEEAGKVQSKITSPAESKEEAEEEAKAIKAMTTWFASIQLDQLPSFKPVMTQGQYALLESLVVPKDQTKPNPENVAVDSKVVKS